LPVSEDVIDCARRFPERLAGEGDDQIDCRTRPGLALVTNPHAIAGLPIDEAEAILAATDGAGAIAPREEVLGDAERREDLTPPAARSFFG
jgi:hypothetical protein